LVTDLPADFEVFGQAVDSSMADLLGGTTGQVLAKNSGTDMDFIWVAQDDSNAIQNAIVDAKGDIIGASANDTPAITSVGANDTILMADSTAATGLKWAGDYTTFTPVITSGTGSFGSTNVQGFRYLKIGKMCHIVGRINIVTVGTAAGEIVSTLPFTSGSSVDQIGVAEEIGTVGFACTVLVNASNSAMAIRKVDYSSAIGANHGISFSLTYEVA
jgi:hypothetical protein